MFLRCLYSVSVLLLITPLLASASTVLFDHIEYDPTGADDGHEWVRIYNASSASVDLSNWRFVEGGTNHKLRPLGTSVLPAGGYAIIAADAEGYVVEHSGSNDVVFDSTFSLSNTGEALALKDASSTVVVSTSYTAAAKSKPEPAPKSKQAVAGKRQAPRLLTKESPTVMAAIEEAPVTHASGLWPWLLGAAALGLSAGVVLVWVRSNRTQSGYTVIDISDKNA